MNSLCNQPFLFKSNKPFSEKVAYVYNCIERSIFSPETFRVFVHFQLQNVLFCEVYVVKGHSPLSQREAMWFHFGALTVTETNIVGAKAWENILNDRAPSEPLRA